MFSVETRNVHGSVTSVGSAGPNTITIDRPVDGGGNGKGFNGGQLLHMAVAGCVANDMFREAEILGIQITSVRVTADGGFGGGPPIASTGITYQVEVEGPSSEDDLRRLVDHVHAIAEIPASLRGGTSVDLTSVTVTSIGGG